MNKKVATTITILSIVITAVSGGICSAAKVIDDRPEFWDAFSQNNIRFYNPDESCGWGDITGECGGEITSTDPNDRLLEVAEKYGLLSMKLQEETGVPWELVFAQMMHESTMGLCQNCVASHVQELNGWNWLGLSYTGRGLYNIEEPYDDGKRKWSVYSSMENMMAGYAIDFLRNGYYSEAFQYSSWDNFNLKNFFYAEIARYCPTSDGCNHDRYWSSIESSVNKIRAMAKEKGWPNSEEFAKSKKIPVGGKYQNVGPDIHNTDEFKNIQPHSLNMECVTYNTSSGSSTIDEDTGIVGNGKRVTMLGDSISRRATEELKKVLPGIDLDAQSHSGWANNGLERAYKIQSGLDRLRAMRNKGTIRDVVVFALGQNNGNISQNDFNELMSLTTGKKVVLMTFYHSNGRGNSEGAKRKNRQIMEYAAKYRNIVIADWAAAVEKNPSRYIDKDGLHPNMGNGIRLFSKVIAQAVNKSTGTQAVNATWQNGWITSGFEGYRRESVQGKYTPGDSEHLKDFTTKSLKDNASYGPNKITLHNTEGGDGGGTSGLALYGTNGFPAHFTINLKKKTVFQHHPINKPANSIASYDTSAGIQIEIIGYSTEENKNSEWYLLDNNKFTKNEWIYLAKLLVAISNETGIPLQTSLDWENPQRLSAGKQFDHYEGVLAHMHTPAPNDHTDTGNIWPMLSEAIQSVQAAGNEGFCGAQDKPWYGDFPWWDQCDPQWKETSYGGCGTTCSSGCGVVSFAMMATALTGIERRPDEVTKLAGSKGLHVCGKGSSHSLPLVLAPEYGLIAESIDSASIDQINAKLRDGYMIWTCGGGSNPFTSAGHCIGIRGITDDGKWLIADSNGEKGRVNTLETTWDPSFLRPRMNNAKAIKARSTP